MTILSKDGLPREAYAIQGVIYDSSTWRLPHHTPLIGPARRRRRALLPTVDWDIMPEAVAMLSMCGYKGQRVQASAEEIIAAAKHLAEHYRAAGKPVPATLQALI